LNVGLVNINGSGASSELIIWLVFDPGQSNRYWAVNIAPTWPAARSDAKEAWTLSRTVTDEELAELVHRVIEAAQALIRGDIEGYVARIKHADDYTLMSPYGGDPVRGFEDSEDARAALARFFRGGEATVEVVETYVSGDLAVLVVIERQHGTIGDLPEQDWSLRVTWVFRRTPESDWELVHRHADALVHPIDHERLGKLARGE
jgi:ketosteroid isomerase-like protein